MFYFPQFFHKCVSVCKIVASLEYGRARQCASGVVLMRSLTYIRNRVGPSTVPWGTLSSFKFFPSLTRCFVFYQPMVLFINMGSPDLKKIGSDREGYQKNKERVHELKVLWKKERLHATINKYIETVDVHKVTSFFLQIVAFEMWNSSPHFGVGRLFYNISTSPRELDSFQGCKISWTNLLLSRTDRKSVV